MEKFSREDILQAIRNRIPVIILSVFFLLLPLLYSTQVFESASIPRHIFIAFTSSILLFIFSINIIKKKELSIPIALILLSLVVLWAALSSLWGLDTQNAYIELTQLINYLVIAYLAYSLAFSAFQRVILAFLFSGASIAALLGILQAFNLPVLDIPNSGIVSSTFNNKNHAAAYFDLVIPLALVCFLSAELKYKWLAGITYSLSITFILLAKTKGSLLAIAVMSFVFLCLLLTNTSLRKTLFSRHNITFYLLLTFIFPISIYSLAETSETSTPKKWNVERSSKSVNSRIVFYKNAYPLLRDNWIKGVGYGSFRKSYIPYSSGVEINNKISEDKILSHLHNDPYQYLIELGIIVGILIFIYFCFLLARSLQRIKSINHEQPSSNQLLLLGCLLSIIAGSIHSLVDFPLRLPSSSALFWFILGLLIAFATSKKISVPAKFNTPVFFILITVSIFWTYHNANFYVRYFIAAKNMKTATISVLNEQNCQKAKNEIELAKQLFFEDFTIRQRYAQIYSECNYSQDEKLAAMNSVLSIDHTNTRARLTRATLYLQSGQLDLAEKDLHYVSYVLPHRPAALLGLGDLYSLRQEYKNARPYYEKALSLDPNNQKATLMLKQFEDAGL